jgi:hypothetical protein
MNKIFDKTFQFLEIINSFEILMENRSENLTSK